MEVTAARKKQYISEQMNREQDLKKNLIMAFEKQCLPYVYMEECVEVKSERGRQDCDINGRTERSHWKLQDVREHF